MPLSKSQLLQRFGMKGLKLQATQATVRQEQARPAVSAHPVALFRIEDTALTGIL